MNLLPFNSKISFCSFSSFVGAGGLEGENGNPEALYCNGFPGPEPDDETYIGYEPDDDIYI
jgi:hypothetical protein